MRPLRWSGKVANICQHTTYTTQLSKYRLFIVSGQEIKPTAFDNNHKWLKMRRDKSSDVTALPLFPVPVIWIWTTLPRSTCHQFYVESLVISKDSTWKDIWSQWKCWRSAGEFRYQEMVRRLPTAEWGLGRRGVSVTRIKKWLFVQASAAVVFMAKRRVLCRQWDSMYSALKPEGTCDMLAEVMLSKFK